MIEGRPSETALMVAALRGAYCLSLSKPEIQHDHLAMHLSGFDKPEQLVDYVEQLTAKFESLSNRAMAEALIFDMTSFIAVRSLVVEDQLAKAVTRGIEQLVVLGAGLDSTAYRRTDLTANLDVFEVDHPATQAWKQKRLSDAGIDIPDNLTFVAYDFENQTLEQALEQGGVLSDRTSFFSWLGVQPYLTDASVMATLDVIGHFPTGSELVMDIITPEKLSEIAQNDNASTDDEDSSLQDLVKLVGQMGEPFLTRYTPIEFTQRLRSSGFGRINVYDSDTLNSRFFASEPHLAMLNQGRSARALAAKVA